MNAADWILFAALLALAVGLLLCPKAWRVLCLAQRREARAKSEVRRAFRRLRTGEEGWLHHLGKSSPQGDRVMKRLASYLCTLAAAIAYGIAEQIEEMADRPRKEAGDCV